MKKISYTVTFFNTKILKFNIIKQGSIIQQENVELHKTENLVRQENMELYKVFVFNQ